MKQVKINAKEWEIKKSREEQRKKRMKLRRIMCKDSQKGRERKEQGRAVRRDS
jgi:hypothetical protein